MFVYVRAEEIVICPGYEDVVHFGLSEALKLKFRKVQ
jgi:hypothetical protein